MTGDGDLPPGEVSVGLVIVLAVLAIVLILICMAG